jgi:hypothetical protein
MKRYYISPIIGDGTEENPFRPKVADHGVAWVGSIPSDPDTGHPLFAWTLVLVNAINHGPLLADQTIDAMPDFPLDGKVNAINTATKNAMLSKMQARGINTEFIGNADGYRDVIRGVGQKLEPTFSENNFDVN